MSEKKSLKISEVKGRPMLHWIGKQPLETVKSFPAQLVETFNIEDAPKIPTFDALKKDWSNLLFHGDNKEILSSLLVNGFRNKIDLIYIDPPFASGADYVRKVELRGTKEKLEGEEESLIEQIQYTDIWANDNYLQFMYERFILLRELLSDKGSIYVHCDWHKSHHLRFLMDEVFGADNFRNEIVWCYYGPGSPGMRQFNRKHDNIFWYAKNNEWFFNGEDIRIPYHETTAKKFESEGTGFGGERELADGKIPEDWWPLPIVNRIRTEILNYPTQKPMQLIEKIIAASSNEGSIVLDCFIGSGTTAAVAQKLGRKWIGCDLNKGAIQTTSKRLQGIINEQQKEIKKQTEKLKLEEEKKLYTSFAHYKINDYDVQMQHNELKELAVEHIGIKRIATDSFFDGTLGSELVKMIPFNHPLSVLDLQLVKDELEKRRGETRNIVLVSLGMEVKAKIEIENYNRLRPLNKIRLIELRTDKKYGSFFVHKPAQAEVEITKTKDKGKVIIKDFISPSILQRLNIEKKLFQAQIKDFRSQIDVVLIDTNYNGEIFNIIISDVPEKKTDFIKGAYEFELQKKDSKIAVKIIDMLGEEITIIK